MPKMAAGVWPAGLWLRWGSPSSHFPDLAAHHFWFQVFPVPSKVYLYFQHICIFNTFVFVSAIIGCSHSCFQVVPSSFSLFSLFGVGFTNFFKFPSLLTGPYFGFWLIHADTGARCMFKIKCSLLWWQPRGMRVKGCMRPTLSFNKSGLRPT